MSPLELNITLDFTIQPKVNSVDVPIAATRINKKPPYSEYAEFRDFLWELFDDKKHYKVLSYKPSTEAPQDNARLGAIIPLRYSSDPTDVVKYKTLIRDYLLTPPQSWSFYLAVDVLNDQGLVNSRWILDVRIGTHISQEHKNPSESTIKHFTDTFHDGKVLPLDFILTTNAKQNRQPEYNNIKLNILGMAGDQIVCNSLAEIKKFAADYINKLWNICNQKIPPVTTSQDNINAATNITSEWDDFDVHAILYDLEIAITDFNAEKQAYGDYTFDDYIWKCLFVSFDVDENGDKYISEIYVKDNHNSDITLYCEIYSDEYFGDAVYREEILQDLCIALFEEYNDPWGA